MKCPFCAHLGDKVVDSRESKEGEVIRRRRECLACGKRFTTYERIEAVPFYVTKKDGRREDFDPQKLYGGLAKATQKRDISPERLRAHTGSTSASSPSACARAPTIRRRCSRWRAGRAERMWRRPRRRPSLRSTLP